MAPSLVRSRASEDRLRQKPHSVPLSELDGLESSPSYRSTWLPCHIHNIAHLVRSAWSGA